MPEIIMTCGTICCGKSTYAKKIQTERNAVILSILSAAAAGYSLFRMRSGPDRRPRMQCAERPLLLLREFRSRASSGLSRSPRSSGIRFSADDPGVPHRSIYRHPGSRLCFLPAGCPDVSVFRNLQFDRLIHAEPSQGFSHNPPQEITENAMHQ